MAEAMCWGLVQRSALDGAHPAWFHDMPLALVDAARGDPAGRRLLALGLVDAAPQIFAGFPAAVPAALAASEWMHTAPTLLDERALDLGALAYAPLLRLRITRGEVVRLRSVLGAERYARVLAETDVDGTPTAAAALFDAAFESDQALRRVLLEQGRREWAAHARDVHPVALEWLRLCHAPGAIEAPDQGWLAATTTSRVLASTLQENGDARESRHH
jgi:hypothetical protein